MIHLGKNYFLIVSILTKYDSIEGMEENTNQIMQYDVSLNNNISEIIKLFNQTSLMKTYSLNKINSTLMRTIEDAQSIKEKYNSMIFIFKKLFYLLRFPPLFYFCIFNNFTIYYAKIFILKCNFIGAYFSNILQI